ncbi:MAG: lysylphosphatidylglycerol synthase transmembrane domain-containing protein [Pseudomonadota bacterium]
MSKNTIPTLFFRKILPWILAILLFVYLFYAYPPAQVWQALKFVNPILFIILSLGYFIFLYWADCWSTAHILTNYGLKFSTAQLIPPRGITYLIMNINYGASQAAFAYYLKKKFGASFTKSLGIFTVIMFVDFCWVIFLAFLGTYFQQVSIRGLDLTHWVRLAMIFVALGVIANLIFWHWMRHKMQQGKRLEGKFWKWLYQQSFFYVFVHSKIKDYIKIAFYRIPIHLAIIASMYFLIRIFGANVPLTDIMGKIPLVHLVSTIPVVPGGLGSIQFALVELLRDTVTHPMISKGIINGGELLLAAVLLWLFVNAILKTIVGLYYFRTVPRELFQKKS